MPPPNDSGGSPCAVEQEPVGVGEDAGVPVGGAQQGDQPLSRLEGQALDPVGDRRRAAEQHLDG